MNDYQLNIHKKIEQLQEKKKQEVMKAFNTFVLNEEVNKIDEEILEYRMQCKHELITNNKCDICGKHIN
jgi:hypothetical protein